jgi:hypothetical protein
MSLDKGVTTACDPSLVLNALGYSVFIRAVLLESTSHTVKANRKLVNVLCFTIQGSSLDRIYKENAAKGWRLNFKKWRLKGC